MLKLTALRKSNDRKITFVLPSDHPAGNVSVVGDFNAWTPGAHVLRKRSNGTMSASITVPAGTTVRFRFLGEQGWWFDEGDADEITHEGSVLRAA